MELKDLRCFQRIAELGSLRGAAEALGVSQPALSKSLRRLEGGLGVRLFERTARGVALTTPGKALYARNAVLMQLADEIPRELEDLKAGRADRLRVGAVPALVDGVVCPALARCLHSGVPSGFSLHVQLSGALLRELSAGHLDFALAALDDRVAGEFAFLPLGEQQSFVVARAGHPLLRRRFELADLAAHAWVLPPKDVALRRWVDGLFEPLGAARRPLFVETDTSPVALAALVAASDALTVMTEDSLASPGARELRRLPPPAPQWKLQIALYWRRSAYISAAMRSWRAEIERAFASRRRGRPAPPGRRAAAAR